VEIAAVLPSIPVVIGLAAAGAGVWALAAQVLMQALIRTLGMYTFARWRPGLTLAGGKLRPLLRFGTTRLSTAACYIAYQQADVLVLGKVCGSFALGLYTVALQISQLPVEKISAVVNQLAVPVMAELQADRAAVRAVVLRGLRLVASVTLPLCVAVMLLADDLVLVALTDKWSGAIPVLRLLSLYALSVRSRCSFPQHCSPRIGLGSCSLTIWCCCWSCRWPSGSARSTGRRSGVAAAWLVVYPLVMVWLVREALQEIGLSWTASREASLATGHGHTFHGGRHGARAVGNDVLDRVPRASPSRAHQRRRARLSTR
jgi:hypothetical protein